MLYAATTGRVIGSARCIRTGGIVVLTALLLAAGGCGPSRLVSIDGQTQFEQQVLQAPRPVLLSFYKIGCPACVMQKSALESLAREYAGRVDVARARVTDQAIERYDLCLVPTTILFVDGQEQQRWQQRQSAATLRVALEGVLAQAGCPPPSFASPGPRGCTGASCPLPAGRGARMDVSGP